MNQFLLPGRLDSLALVGNNSRRTTLNLNPLAVELASPIFENIFGNQSRRPTTLNSKPFGHETRIISCKKNSTYD